MANVDRSVTQAISLAQSVKRNSIVYVDASSDVGLSQRVDRNMEYGRSVESRFLVEQNAGKTTPAAANNDIAFAGVVSRVYDSSNAIAFDGTATAMQSKGATNSVAFTGEAVANQVAERDAENAIAFTGTARAIKETNCVLNDYAPARDADSSVPASFNFVKKDFVRFTYEGLAVVLKPPKFGNSDRVDPLRAKNVSRGGTIDVYRDASWSKPTLLDMSFFACVRTSALEVQAFLDSTLGQEVYFFDQEDSCWRGIVLNPDGAVEQAGRNDFQVQIQFQGSRVTPVDRANTQAISLGQSNAKDVI